MVVGRKFEPVTVTVIGVSPNLTAAGMIALMAGAVLVVAPAAGGGDESPRKSAIKSINDVKAANRGIGIEGLEANFQ